MSTFLLYLWSGAASCCPTSRQDERWRPCADPLRPLQEPAVGTAPPPHSHPGNLHPPPPPAPGWTLSADRCWSHLSSSGSALTEKTTCSTEGPHLWARAAAECQHVEVCGGVCCRWVLCDTSTCTVDSGAISTCEASSVTSWRKEKRTHLYFRWSQNTGK